MSRLRIVFAALAAVAAAGLASTASAATVFDTSLTNPPGVFFGTGNFNTHYAVTTKGGLEIGLKSKITGSPADSTVPVGDVYSFALGTPKISFDYAVIPGSIDLTGATETLTIENLGSGQIFSFDPSLLSDNSTSGSAFENSEQLGFFPIGFSASNNDTYDVTLSLSNVKGVDGVVSVENVIKVGAGIPEPGAWALMILGFGGAGAALRRQRRSASAAAMA